jgi:hypothetical protein
MQRVIGARGIPQIFHLVKPRVNFSGICQTGIVVARAAYSTRRHLEFTQQQRQTQRQYTPAILTRVKEERWYKFQFQFQLRQYSQTPKTGRDVNLGKKHDDLDLEAISKPTPTPTPKTAEGLRSGKGSVNEGTEAADTSKMSIGARIRYFLIKQNRPFNIDEVTAFLSWILMGHFLWIVIGTTTFIGFLIYIVNWIGDGEVEKLVLRKLITFDNKLNIDMTHPKFGTSWEDGMVKVRNLKVHSNPKVASHSDYELEISEISLTFSFNKWMDGQGLIDKVEIEGLYGNVNLLDGDQLLLDESFSDEYLLNHLKVKHSEITFHSDVYFKEPLKLVVFNCDMDRLRRKWMVYDFLNASSLFGSLGGSLFTLHKRQHKFAHFSGMDLHDQSDDDHSNTQLKNVMDRYSNFGSGVDASMDELDYSRSTAIERQLKQNGYQKQHKHTIMNDEHNEHSNEYTFTGESACDKNNGGGGKSSSNGDIWKKMTRLRIDMLDLSFLNNENSKLNWIESGKAEIIFDIMLPSEDDDNVNDFSGKVNDLSKEFNFEFSMKGFKNMFHTVYKKLVDDVDDDHYGSGDGKVDDIGAQEQNKYVVIDMKINYFNLTAKCPAEVPKSSLTGLPYITSQDMQSLVTFINDEKFGLSSSRYTNNNRSGVEKQGGTEENPFDGSELESNANANSGDNEEGRVGYVDNYYHEKDHDDDFRDEEDIDARSGGGFSGDVKMLPPIKFRIIQNLNDFEYLDLPSLVNFTNMTKPEGVDATRDSKLMKSFVNTNKFIDNSIVEMLALLLIYKEEIQTRLIDMYSRRSGFEILFNNFLLGNLILVGLGSFVI